MPKAVYDWQAELYSREKQVVEAHLAKSLYGYFNKGEALSNLQTLAGRIVSGMLYGVEDAKGLFEKSTGKEGALEVYSKMGKTWQAADGFYKRNGEATLTASEVSDLIRLFGQWVEYGGLARPGLTGTCKDDWGQDLANSSAVKDAYRPGVQGGGAWKQNVEAVWGDKKKGERFQNVDVARRDRGGGWAIEKHLEPYMRNPKAFSGMAGDPAKNSENSKRAKGDSNVLKIDRLFGLVVGCDISGTTTDTAFALETQGVDLLTAVYYMLPLATIVYQNHHALIEVALALSLNGVLDYHVGWYTTLKPLAVTSTIGGLSKEFAGLDSVLETAESDPRNRHFMCYYRDNKLAGAYLFSSDEARRLRAGNVFKGTTLLQKALELPKTPTEEAVRSLVESAGVSCKQTW